MFRFLSVDIVDVDGGEVGTVSDGQQTGGGERRAGTEVLPAPALHPPVLLDTGTGRLRKTGHHHLTGQQEPGENSQLVHAWYLSDYQTLSLSPRHYQLYCLLSSQLGMFQQIKDRLIPGKYRDSVRPFLFEVV